MGVLQRVKQRGLSGVAKVAEDIARRRQSGPGAQLGPTVKTLEREIAALRAVVSNQAETLTGLESRPSDTRVTRSMGPQQLANEQSPVSRVLYERLSGQDLTEVEALLKTDPGASDHLSQATTDQAKRHVILAYGMWHGAPAVLEKTGLIAELPPEDIHAMARGPLAAAGGTYEANMVANALESVGVEVASLRSALDFGCSSGRVVRVLAAAYPEVNWHGCDPNAPAIEWGGKVSPQIDFLVSGNEPPLSFEAGSLDLAYAISIWSHFEPQLGLRWFEELHRVIRPGGYLLFTTHGPTSVAHYALNGSRTAQQSSEILDALYRQGWWYAPEFGEEGDWGVVNPDWGTAFLSPEWVLAQLCPQWRVLEFAPGRNQGNQDVYLLQRAQETASASDV